MIRFDGQVVIVTGAGSGLGRGYALALAARGANVVCNDIASASAEAVAAEIVDGGGTAVAQCTAVGTAEAGAEIVGCAIDTYGGLHAVVNNAGRLLNAPFEDMTPHDFEESLRTNLSGSFYVTQCAYRHMKAAGYGRIVLTSSGVGAFGWPWQANYASAKAGLLGLANVIALEGAAHGIVVNTVLPHALGTSMGRDGGGVYPPEHMAEMRRAFAPLRSDVTVEKVVPLVVYLASRQCTTTGRAFSASCGRFAEVFAGSARGWVATGDAPPAPEDVAGHLDEICDQQQHFTFASATEEIDLIAAQRSPGGRT